MGLIDYSVKRDKFEANQFGPLCFPCSACTHAGGEAQDEPCRTCDHNANAEPEEVCPNCETALPQGCGGLFRDDGDQCWLNKQPPKTD